MATAVLDLELAQLPVEVGDLVRYEHALVLLRLHGVPMAHATVPVTDGRDHLACVQEPLGCYRMQHVSMVTDSVRTERELMAVLDKFFCHTDLPPQAVADRHEVYTNWLLWLSFLHYIGARWEAAQRDMAEAVALNPALRQGRLLDAIVNEAFNPRVDDPLLFIRGVIAHLPATVHLTPVEEDRLMGRGHIGLALRSYRADDVGCAQQQLTLAHRLYHSLYRYQEDFANDLLEYAMSLPTCPRLTWQPCSRTCRRKPNR